jgi:Arc/MetJ family transcription regulator
VSKHFSPMPTNLKLDDRLIGETVRLGNFKTKKEAVNTALAEFVSRRQRLRILELAGKIDFDPEWNYKQMRGKLS